MTRNGHTTESSLDDLSFLFGLIFVVVVIAVLPNSAFADERLEAALTLGQLALAAPPSESQAGALHQFLESHYSEKRRGAQFEDCAGRRVQ